MAQQFDYPETETQLREILDKLYQHSKEVHDSGGRPAFKGLIEIMSAEATIITAIHNIKSNHGSETPGVDSKTMQKDYLQKPFSWVIKDIQSAFKHFEAQKIRRKYIDKPGKSEKRPLGIPTIRDRIVQECMRIVLEPILEAQFFYHSYGFRPMRDTAMALQRINYLTFQTGYHWIVEGDISKCFDCIDHSILLKRLYHMGIKDRRVLQIIKVKQKIPSVKYRDIYVGFTALTFCNWEKTFPKNKNETPYSETGRQIYFKRTKKKRINARLDEMYSVHTARIVTNGSWGKLNNFEFIMNRAYALNRDKLKCRVCGGWLISGTPLAHRVNPNLPLNKVNRVDNLVSLHKHCFDTVNNPHADISEFDVKAQKKIQGFREKLVPSHTCNE